MITPPFCQITILFWKCFGSPLAFLCGLQFGNHCLWEFEYGGWIRGIKPWVQKPKIPHYSVKWWSIESSLRKKALHNAGWFPHIFERCAYIFVKHCIFYLGISFPYSAKKSCVGAFYLSLLCSLVRHHKRQDAKHRERTKSRQRTQSRAGHRSSVGFSIEIQKVCGLEINPMKDHTKDRTQLTQSQCYCAIINVNFNSFMDGESYKKKDCSYHSPQMIFTEQNKTSSSQLT